MRLSLFIIVVVFITGCTKPKDVVTEIRNSDGNIIAFNSCGEGDTTLLFVHGWCINKEYWDSQLEFFCAKNYHVVAIDLPGFGASGKNGTTWSMQKYGEDVADVIDALQLKNVVLIGHSMSGNIVLETLDQHPADVIGVVGVDNFQNAGVVLNDEQKKEVDEFFDTLANNFKVMNEVFATNNLFQPSTDSAVRKRVIKDFVTADPNIAIPVLRSLEAAGAREADILKTLKFPLVLVNSSALNTNEESLKEKCKSSYRLHTVGPTGHYPMLENPAVFNAALLKGVRGK